jgi:hypothetical protein
VDEGSAKLPPAWEKARVLSVIITTLAVPIVVAYVGGSLSKEQKRDEITAKYVELAIDILKAPPNEDTRALRSWAISVVNKYSEVPLSKAVQEELQHRAYAKEIQQVQTAAQSMLAKIQESASTPQAAAIGTSSAPTATK